MKQHITLGSSPVSEVCVQLGASDYADRSIAECEAYKKQLHRYFQTAKNRRPLCSLAVKSFPHDFGNYLEVVAVYEDNNRETLDDAIWFEGHLPEEWDTDARQELGL